jgi:hypothetical protein
VTPSPLTSLLLLEVGVVDILQVVEAEQVDTVSFPLRLWMLELLTP